MYCPKSAAAPPNAAASQPVTQPGSYLRWTEFACCGVKCWAVAFIDAKPAINVNTLSFASLLGVCSHFVIFILVMQRRQACVNYHIGHFFFSTSISNCLFTKVERTYKSHILSKQNTLKTYSIWEIPKAERIRQTQVASPLQKEQSWKYLRLADDFKFVTDM